MAFAGSVILKAMGVEAVGLDALLASAGIAAGFASQKILQNLAAGVILLLFRPFKVGDKICVNNVMGWVTKIMLFETTLLTDDRRKISMPNHEIYSGYIDNLTAGGMRRVQVAMLVAGSSDIAGTRKALEEAIAKFAYLAEPKSDSLPVRCTKKKQASMMGVLAVAMSLDLLKHTKNVLKQEQKIAQATCGGFMSAGHSAMHRFVEVTEEIARTLQHRKIKLASQAMERNRS
ncbi:hypothetical protein GUITHDRAFT_105159 [Guillardia theta CCMP2712]|uniref:Mechanosensitive ion channel MscS domain-containing protein n=1 Tax=Guillardia theta (strain CCMP2712) TaxID=905079 RepID=L1JLQ8_GUITC|nr:hypothetical protein GUITHDRAFT_105159 [Guillardia theta CCMP2712]EKX49075.1 hypothetical protein GUITHDRAFT_105159 [Guillardia theta CCMP2712]|eukprot:XP_005836055.1 hypothetical protein GUITHDRAFT_105159 [Guillardia theta CCMP2712]